MNDKDSFTKYTLEQFKTYDSIIENLQKRIKYLEYKELIFKNL